MRRFTAPYRKPEQRQLDHRDRLFAVHAWRPILLAMAECTHWIAVDQMGQFDGASTNFNGAGRNAHANNTIFGYVWIAF